MAIQTMVVIFHLGLLLLLGSAIGKPRNIIFIVADDLGWNDVGFHNPDIISPNIDRLARQGVILNSSYMNPTCTPSRHAFMTGVYPFKVGLQRRALFPFEAHCSPLNMTFVPQKLKELGYSTHMVGKWHLGDCSWNCTPTYRGFDSFYGMYNGRTDYYTKMLGPGVDFNDGKQPLNDTTYSTFLYAKRAQQIIETHKTKPFFLYLPFQAVHSPVQVPKQYEEMYPNIQNITRRQFSGMVTAMDEAIGNITDTLIQNNIMNDTLIIFVSDNGGMVTDGGNNYPLRGSKVDLFEGGTRAVTFVTGNGIERSGYTYNGLLHAVDWYPTIIAAAGGDVTSSENGGIDGINQWDAIRTGADSNRTEFVYNIDNGQQQPNGHAAIRVGNYKLIDGYPGRFNDWYKPDSNETDGNVPWPGLGLFDLAADPEERNDLSSLLPLVVSEMRAKLAEYQKDYVEPKPPLQVPGSFPANFGGYWMPGWC